VTAKPNLSTGARPAGIADEAGVPAAVQQMFDTIAPRYDLLNHLLSAGMDRVWWRRAARTFHHILAQPQTAALDLCCGTGDMTLALEAHRPKTPDATPILAVDFSREMLARAAPKFAGRNIQPIEADALHLPIASGSIDLITSAFGFRNLASYEDGLAELHRVLRPGGCIGILECNQPSGLTGAFYSLYFKRVLPILGGLISGSASAYRYLPASVERFPRPPCMLEKIAAAGFTDAAWTGYTFGIAGLYTAQK
jgi:demethylmenaquinone methyltransferase / 2-methoxy-6-polyprenyl-1,4-benzoquinol methylase